MTEKSSTEKEPQLTSTEQKVKSIWQDILGVSSISKDVHFLDLNGDSLAAMACISSMRELLGVEFTVEEFFLEDATISGFSELIDREAAKTNEV